MDQLLHWEWKHTEKNGADTPVRMELTPPTHSHVLLPPSTPTPNAAQTSNANSPPTTRRHVAVFPASVIVSGEAPRLPAPCPGVPAVVVSTLQLHVLAGREDELVGLSRHPLLAVSPVDSHVDCTIIPSTTARVALACTREHVRDSPYHGGCNMHIDSNYNATR